MSCCLVLQRKEAKLIQPQWKLGLCVCVHELKCVYVFVCDEGVLVGVECGYKV